MGQTWQEIAAIFLERTGDASYYEEAGRWIPSLLQYYVNGPDRAKYFELWETEGFHVTPVHFYQPVPDSRAIPESTWDSRSAMPGVDLREARQLRLLREVFPRFREEYEGLPSRPTSIPHEFHFGNGLFDNLDAAVLYCMIRAFKPRRILEIGSGYSTRLMSGAALRNGSTRLTVVDPYAGEMVAAGMPGLHRLIRQPVQDLDLALFQRLRAGDLLFIDTTHVVRIGGDVNFLFLEVLPRLKPGVLVHIHDIFLPYEYPRHWVKDLHYFWTEQYLLHAFLIGNRDYEVVLANRLLIARHIEEVRAAFPRVPFPERGASFWIRRNPDLGARAAGAVRTLLGRPAL